MYAFAFLMFCPKLSLLSYSNCLLFLRFGRKLILRCCLLQLAVSGTCTAFAPTFLIYCSLRFWSGCSAVVVISNNGMLSKLTILISSIFQTLNLILKFLLLTLLPQLCFFQLQSGPDPSQKPW